MSLIILKVNREKKTHSAYCEGFTGSERVYRTKANKIIHIDAPKYSILLGTTGVAKFVRYFRHHFEEHFKKTDILLNLDNRDLSCERIEDLVFSIWRSFCLDNRFVLDNKDFSDFGCALSINGYLFVVNNHCCDDKNTFQAYDVTDRDYCANGQEEVAALCLLENGIEVQRIFDTIYKFNCHINNNVSSIENICYADKI